jgi:protocatechuate 3,4-dioxygenase beta subunit
LALVPAERRVTLLAVPSSDLPDEFLWDIRLQGERETVFFEA